LTTASKTQAQALSQIQTLTTDWIIPDATSEHNKLAQVVACLDIVESLGGQALGDGIDLKLLQPSHKVAYDLLRKYKIFVAPETLSERALVRLHNRKNYPRFTESPTLREWSDAVLGEGEQVAFLVPCSVRRNTHLASLQRMCQDSEAFFSELLACVRPKVLESEDQVFCSDMKTQETTLSASVNHDVTFSTAQSGGVLLKALEQQAQHRWSPTVRQSISELMQSCEQENGLEMMIRLLDLIDNKQARTL